MPKTMMRTPARNSGSVNLSRTGAREVPVIFDTPPGVDASRVILPPKREVPPAFDISIVFGVNPGKVILFDPLGWVLDNLNITQAAGVTITGVSAAYGPMVKQVAYTPLFISGVNYQTDKTHKPIKFHQADFDGGVQGKTLITSSAKRNTQYRDNLLTLKVDRFLDSYTGFEIQGAAEEEITLTLFVGGRAGALT